MMGARTEVQEALFYEFSLERHVPKDHLVRALDRFVDLSVLRGHLRPFCSDTGHLKRILRLDRLRLRGPLGARDEFHLAAAAQNLRKLAKLVPPALVLTAA